uniref:uncharacterized protein LOC117160819 n=1 Tax=Bombus vancouverensis nearcticus TaxID=2705178 RepID=UPI0014387766|nr:uncharacterized protein LOC117160819 [Bombus vancouverensis nearcticus]
MPISTTADIGAQLIRRGSEVTKVAETSRNLKGTQGKTLKEAARTIAAGITEMVPEDQEREKAADLAARLTRALDSNKDCVATPFRAAEARVTKIDMSATKEKIKNSLAKESGCKPEDVRLGEIRPARNGLGSVWIRGPAGAVRILAQASKVAIGWSTAKVDLTIV